MKKQFNLINNINLFKIKKEIFYSIGLSSLSIFVTSCTTTESFTNDPSASFSQQNPYTSNDIYHSGQHKVGRYDKLYSDINKRQYANRQNYYYNAKKNPYYKNKRQRRYNRSKYLGGANVKIRTKNLGKKDSISYWNGSSASGSPKIIISLREQKARFYKAGKLVGVSRISSGKNGYDTPKGSYTITEKDFDHRSSIYGNYISKSGSVLRKDIDNRKDKKPKGSKYLGTPMPYYLRLSNKPFGLHAGYLPGYAASHGCIRLPDHMAKHFYNNVSLGTKVIIK